MRRKELEGYLGQVEEFEAPQILLEQYTTPVDIAASILSNIEEDLAERRVGDFGCGTGRLSLGCALMGAASVLAIDVDPSAISQAQSSAEELELDDKVHFLLADVRNLPAVFRSLPSLDIVLMNPPFGTKKNAGLDWTFVKTATSLVTRSVFSLHKTSTRPFILRSAKEAGITATVTAELRYNLPQTYRFHKEKSKDIAVDFVRFDV